METATLPRSTSNMSYSRLGDHETMPSQGWRASSRRSMEPTSVAAFLTNSLSFQSRRERSARRRIFLQSYKLSSVHAASRRSVEMLSPRLKKVALKMKSAATSVVSFLKIETLGSCVSPKKVRPSSPKIALKKKDPFHSSMTK